MKISNHIKQSSSLLSMLGLIMLLVFSPCKVRNSIQETLEIPKTEVSNKSLSSLNQSLCNIFTDAETVITKSNSSLQLAQVLPSKHSVFNTKNIALSKRPVSHNYNARDQIPPLAPYYILFQNNKAYL